MLKEDGMIMEIRAIETFHAVVKFGSFQKAAEALNYSQPTITFRIKQLETDLGVQLFKRGKQAQLTTSGRLFLEKSAKLLDEFVLLENTVRNIKTETAANFRIGISEPTASVKFPKVLARFLADNPDIGVDVIVGDANLCSQLLEKDEIDFAICGEPETSVGNRYERFFKDELVVLVNEHHRVAQQDSLKIKDLKGERFLFTPNNCPIRIQIEHLLQKKIGSNYNKMVLSSSMAHKYYVQADLGISLFTRTANLNPIAGTVVKELEGVSIRPSIGVLTRAQQNNPSENMLDLIARIKEAYLKTELV